MNLQNARKILSIIQDNHKVLDIGGWFEPFNRANFVIDIMPYETRRRDRSVTPDIPEHFTKDTYIQRDLCEREPFPFEDKEFDFVICSHTLEDLRDPIWVCSEIVRVGKAGYIEVPSRIAESTLGIESLFYCGWYHIDS